jgi:glutamate N-acetyltransferase/amino-acid N-acetyltransferase
VPAASSSDGVTITVTGISKGAGDPPEHGHHARLHRHRRQSRPRCAAKPDAGRRQQVVQPHHHRWRHLDQRLLHADRHGRPTLPEVTEACGELFEAEKGRVRSVHGVAQAIVRDGEGATKFVTVQVNGGGNHQECLDVGYAVAHSPLIKTALFASDPNWGRILAAVGRAGVPDLDVSKIDVFLDDVCIASQAGAAGATPKRRVRQ